MAYNDIKQNEWFKHQNFCRRFFFFAVLLYNFIVSHVQHIVHHTHYPVYSFEQLTANMILFAISFSQKGRQVTQWKRQREKKCERAQKKNLQFLRPIVSENDSIKDWLLLIKIVENVKWNVALARPILDEFCSCDFWSCVFTTKEHIEWAKVSEKNNIWLWKPRRAQLIRFYIINVIASSTKRKQNERIVERWWRSFASDDVSVFFRRGGNENEIKLKRNFVKCDEQREWFGEKERKK